MSCTSVWRLQVAARGVGVCEGVREVMSAEDAEEMEPFTMITKEDVGTGLMGTFRSGKTWIQVDCCVLQPASLY